MEAILTFNVDTDVPELYRFLEKNNIKNLTAFVQPDLIKSVPFGQIGWYSCFAKAQEIYDSRPEIRSLKYVRIDGMDERLLAWVDDLGFKVDSSVIGRSPYHPFLYDFRCGGNPCRRILEVPMTAIGNQKVDPTLPKEIFSWMADSYFEYLPQLVISFNCSGLINRMDDFEANMKLIADFGFKQL
jgi:hypothetical protein